MNYRNFEQVWQDIARLQGKDVFTLCQGRKNRILKVDEKGMERLSARKVKSTNIRKARFKKVWKRLVKDRKFDQQSNNFTCACIAHLPEVEYSCKGGILCLYLRQQNTHPFCEVKEYTE